MQHIPYLATPDSTLFEKVTSNDSFRNIRECGMPEPVEVSRPVSYLKVSNKKIHPSQARKLLISRDEKIVFLLQKTGAILVSDRTLVSTM